MTLNDLIRSAHNIASLITSGDIPLLYNGKEADFYLALHDDTMTAELYITEKK